MWISSGLQKWIAYADLRSGLQMWTKVDDTCGLQIWTINVDHKFGLEMWLRTVIRNVN